MESKICTKCGLKKPLTEYFVQSKVTGKIHAECKDCYKQHRKTYYVKHYEKNKEHYRERARIRHMILRTVFREKLLQFLLEHPCVVCGENDPRVLEFDHLDPRKKLFNISQGYRGGQAWRMVLSEIEKCQTLCANCHKRRTAAQFNWYKNI